MIFFHQFYTSILTHYVHLCFFVSSQLTRVYNMPYIKECFIWDWDCNKIIKCTWLQKYWNIINFWYCASQITWPQATWFHTFWFIWTNGIIDETQWILKDFYNPTLYYFPPTWIGLLVWNGPIWYFLHYIFKTDHCVLIKTTSYQK